MCCAFWNFHLCHFLPFRCAGDGNLGISRHAAQVFEHIPVNFQLSEWPSAFPVRDSAGLGQKQRGISTFQTGSSFGPMLSSNQELEASLALRGALWIPYARIGRHLTRAPSLVEVWSCHWQTSVPWNCHYWHLSQRTLNSKL